MGVVFAGMAASLDGCIAGPDGEMDWLMNALTKGEDYGFAATMQRSGAFVLGAETYRGMLAMGMAGDKDSAPTFVVTHDSSLRTRARTVLYSGDLVALIGKARDAAGPDKDVCVMGAVISLASCSVWG